MLNLSHIKKIWPEVSLGLVFFSMPLQGMLYSICLAQFVLTAIILFHKNFHSERIPFWMIMFFLFYLLYPIRNIWSNGVLGFDTEQKLSMLLLPAALFLLPDKSMDFKLTAKFYTVGIFLLSGILAKNIIQFYMQHQTIPFYDQLKSPVHTSYLAMYFAYWFAWVFYSSKLHSLKNILFLLLSGLTAMFVILLTASRAGMINILILTLFIFWTLKINFWKKIVSIITFFSVLSIIGLYFYQKDEPFRQRILDAKNAITSPDYCSTSSGKRFCIWETAIEVIMKNPAGIGPENIHAFLNNAFNEKQYTWAAQANLNAHNQYLQILLAHGYLGLLFFLVILYFGFYQAIKYQLNLFTFALTLLVINFIFESMLETQAGISFFTLIFSTFMFSKKFKNL
ncbi:MAG: ligase [Vicingaceae bacterium]|nr:MAG: ligase [Vicingaceae bacterium]